MRMDAGTRSTVHGGGARLMELLSATAGTILLHRLGKQSRVITDNQGIGIVKQLWNRTRMSRSGSRQGTSIALRAWDILQEGQITLHWHRIAATLNAGKKTVQHGLVTTGEVTTC